MHKKKTLQFSITSRKRDAVNTTMIQNIKNIGGDIAKVINEGNVVWGRLETWEKWSVKEIKSYSVKKIDNGAPDSIPSTPDTPIYKSYSIDGNGNFVGIDKANIAINAWVIYSPPQSSAFYGQDFVFGKDYKASISGYWYNSYVASIKEKGKLIEMVSAPEGTYPDNGEKDGYWYVKKG